MRKISLKKIAELAGVSVATVSYALNDSNQVSEVTRAKIKKIAAEEHYVPNLSARNLRTSSSNLVCAITNTYQGNFNGDVLQEIQNIFGRAGYQLLAVSGQIPSLVRTNMIDGIIMLNYRGNQTELQNLVDSINKPVIFMTNEIKSDNAASIVIDNDLGIKYLVETIHQSIHQKVCFITGDSNSYNSQRRLNAAKKYYTKLFKKNDFEKHVYSGNYDPTLSFELGKKFIRLNRYNSFICFNDDMALGIYHAASQLNKIVGKDISVVGFDNSFESGVISPGLTTIDVDKKAWGQEVVNQYFKLKESGSKHTVTTLKPKLILRESVNIKTD
ncbi:LacI family DNA-binding transcriptional regulator [Lapidilactobacillus mulanensis]|uniref:LacI family DNA-binding transcriptional regulator n=1 Tax=Lapidilactobacillus mulanensis TaxID=2485999 RepID=A0ABW4DP72_9LACO|nr:LacI family DNA-binding transcriptional regulator [Lapidilactobacillus mulanensis]